MKPLLYVFIALITAGSVAVAHANVSEAGARNNDATPPVSNVEVVRKKSKKRNHPFVRCRDNTVSYSRQNVCTGHGGAK